MTRIPPLQINQLPPDLQGAMSFAEQLMGFAPNDVLAMARWPEFLSAVKGLVDVVYGAGELDGGLKRLIGTVVSGAAGCRYCQAHTAHGAATMAGVSAEKLDQVWSYATSPLYSDAERSALSLAQAAGVQPSEVTDAHFAQLRRHFNERQLMEIMGVISLFGLLNRWNETLDTELEEAPSHFATPE